MTHDHDLDDPRLTAYALGELDDEKERAEIEALLAENVEARRLVADLCATARLLSDQLRAEPGPGLTSANRAVIEERLTTTPPRALRWWPPLRLALAASLLLALVGLGTIWNTWRIPRAPMADNAVARHESPGPAAVSAPSIPAAPEAVTSDEEAPSLALSETKPSEPIDSPPAPPQGQAEIGGLAARDNRDSGQAAGLAGKREAPQRAGSDRLQPRVALREEQTSPQMTQSSGRQRSFGLSADTDLSATAPLSREQPALANQPALKTPERQLARSRSKELAGSVHSEPAADRSSEPVIGSAAEVAQNGQDFEKAGKQKPGTYAAGRPFGGGMANSMGGMGDNFAPGASASAMAPSFAAWSSSAPAPVPAMVTASEPENGSTALAAATPKREHFDLSGRTEEAKPSASPLPPPADPGRERFEPITEKPFIRTLEAPLSTFGVDVDTASYALIRRMLLRENRLPPRDAVRIEEMINAFSYEYPQPGPGQPFSVNVEITRCPWNAAHRLARIGLQGRSIDTVHRPPGNIVFLIDVSGSMGEPDKLPLLKTGMRMLTESLVEGDRVSIVTYSNTARVVLDAAPGENKDPILRALDALRAGGSTNGAGGIELAYELAEKNYRPEGTNRVVLATDGDFNVGVTEKAALEKTIAEKARKKIQLTVLGFGRGNLQDDRLMALADKGDGQYHYIDNEREARKVLVEQVAGALVTIARDVKLQVDFNPSRVASYRLIGYEKRALPAEHFQDDTKDSGDLGAGHTVTAFYELVPPGAAGSDAELAGAAPRFITPARPANPEAKESFIVKLKYKPPTEDVSRDLEVPAIDDGHDYADASPDFKFATAVASFGLILRDSPYKGGATLEAVLELASASQDSDSRGERAEFLQLVRRAMTLLRQP